MGNKIVDQLKAGDKYGRLEYLGPDVEDKRKSSWRCRCGTEKTFFTTNVKRGMSKSCGCHRKEAASKRTSDIGVGSEFGRLTVRSELPAIERHNESRNIWIRVFYCECSCGRFCDVRLGNLKSGHTQSCGCANAVHKASSDKLAPVIDRDNDYYGSKLHRKYHGIIQRCTNPKASHYKRYGGRGIGIDPHWMGEDGFYNFREYITALPNYSDNLEIDRKDNEKGYCRGNIRMATRSEQARNIATSRIYTVLGDIYETCKDAAVVHNVDPTTIRSWCGLAKTAKGLRPAKHGCSWEWKYPDAHR